jgi:hypothetical protein
MDYNSNQSIYSQITDLVKQRIFSRVKIENTYTGDVYYYGDVIVVVSPVPMEKMGFRN